MSDYNSTDEELTDWQAIIGRAIRQEKAGSTSSSSFDRIFELLKKRRRRYVLYYLRGTSTGTAHVDELVDQVVAWEAAAGNDLPDLRASVAISLQHVHLPKLADACIIDYDEDRGIAEYRNTDEFSEWLARAALRELQ